MTTGESIWYVDVNGGLARVDVGAGFDRWTMPRDLHESFPALLAFGARRQTAVGKVTEAFQTGPNELVLRVTAARWTEFLRFDIERAVRLDVATGAVLEYPAAFGANDRIGNSRVGFYEDGWRRYRIFNNEAWDVLNTVTREFIARHQWTDSVFRLPGGGTVGLPPGGVTLGVVDGQLYVRPNGSEWSYRVFDLDKLVTDGLDHGGREPHFPIPDRMTRAWSMTTDPDSWYASRPGGEFSRSMLEAINTTALLTGGGAAELLLSVMNAESGLRTNAYHPAGRYGLLQMSADQLRAAGWVGTPDEFLNAGERQIPVIRTHMAGLDIPQETDETGLWLCLLLPANERVGVGLDTVIAAPNGPRPQLWATHGVADIGGDGQLTLDGLRRYLRSKRRDSRLTELLKRTRELAAPIPDWPNLTEVIEGDDMGIVRPSAAQLGLTVEIIALQQEPGFDHEQVVSIDPPAGTLAPLTRPVRVTVNFEG